MYQCFISINLFNPYNKLMNELLFYFPYFIDEKLETEKLSNMFIQLVEKLRFIPLSL